MEAHERQLLELAHEMEKMNWHGCMNVKHMHGWWTLWLRRSPEAINKLLEYRNDLAKEEADRQAAANSVPEARPAPAGDPGSSVGPPGRDLPIDGELPGSGEAVDSPEAASEDQGSPGES